MAPVLLFDRDCGMCTRSAALAITLRCGVEPIAWQEWEPRAAYGLTDEALAEKLHLVETAGGPPAAAPGATAYVGHVAVGETLRRSSLLPVRLVGRAVLLRVLAPVAGRVYDWVAAHRHQLPGGTPACRLEP